MSGLMLDRLPEMPQTATLMRVVKALWGREDVVALWMGGSIARGSADQYSDLDLRVAVAGSSLETWSGRNSAALIGERVVGERSQTWDGTVLHHMVLADGIILDLLIQGVDREPPEDFTLVLGCRDPAFGEKLACAHLLLANDPGPADPDAVRQAVVDFWIASHKHAKVLGRGLDMLAVVGLGIEQSVLMRLWYVEATGRDQDMQRGTIHTLTHAVRIVMEATSAHGLETLGAARGSRSDILCAVEINRDEVSRVGRRLADMLGFVYPEALEQTVREFWRCSLGGIEEGHGRRRKLLGAAAVITDAQGRVLLVKHGYGKLNWEIPGGAAEADESAADTATREVFEETGMRVTAERLTGIYYMPENDSHHFVFLCALTLPHQEPHPDHAEITECGYFPSDDLPRPISDFTVRRIQEALTGTASLLPISIGPRQWLEEVS